MSEETVTPVEEAAVPGQPQLVTNFNEFTSKFGTVAARVDSGSVRTDRHRGPAAKRSRRRSAAARIARSWAPWPPSAQAASRSRTVSKGEVAGSVMAARKVA